MAGTDSERAVERRHQLEAAGLALLAEGGWSALTTRNLAARSGLNAGLIHYYYGGLPRLHRAVAERALRDATRPAVEALVTGTEVWPAVARLVRAVAEEDSALGRQRVTAHVAERAFRDGSTRELVRDELRRARDELTRWIGRLHPHWDPERVAGTATAVTALLDGLLLHRVIDPELDLRTAAAGLDGVTEHAPHDRTLNDRAREDPSDRTDGGAR